MITLDETLKIVSKYKYLFEGEVMDDEEEF